MSQSPAERNPAEVSFSKSHQWIAEQNIFNLDLQQPTLKLKEPSVGTREQQTGSKVTEGAESGPHSRRSNKRFLEPSFSENVHFSQRTDDIHAIAQQSQYNGLSNANPTKCPVPVPKFGSEANNQFAMNQLGLQRRSLPSDPTPISLDQASADSKRVKQGEASFFGGNQRTEELRKVQLTVTTCPPPVSGPLFGPSNKYFQKTSKIKDIKLPALEPEYDQQFMSPQSPEPTDRADPQLAIYKTPERSTKRKVIGDVSLQKITEERFVEEDSKSIRRRELALQNDYFKFNHQQIKSKQQTPQIPHLSNKFTDRDHFHTPRMADAQLGNERSYNQQNPLLISRNNFSFGNPPDSLLKLNPVFPVAVPRQALGQQSLHSAVRRERSNSMHLSIIKESDFANAHNCLQFQKSPLLGGESPNSDQLDFDFEESFSETREKLVRIGSGSFSVIYMFQNRCDKSDYVVKRLTDLERGIRESQITNHIRNKCYSRYIVRFHYSWLAENTVNILFEKCEEDALNCFGRNKSQLTEEDVVTFVRSAAEALAELHRIQVVHLDVKPDNVLVSKDGCFKLGDFGHSRRLDSDEDLKHIDEGDFDYTPAEFKGEVDVSDVREHKIDLTKVDIFSLGLSAVKLLSILREVSISPADREQIRLGNLVFIDRLEIASQVLREKLFSMLDLDPAKRPSARALLDGWEHLPPTVPSYFRLSIFD